MTACNIYLKITRIVLILFGDACGIEIRHLQYAIRQPLNTAKNYMLNQLYFFTSFPLQITFKIKIHFL